MSGTIGGERVATPRLPTLPQQHLQQSRQSVSFRFVHETNDRFQLLEFDSDKISIADLKILIAKATGLEKEFARKFDIKVYLFDSSSLSSSSSPASSSSSEDATLNDRQPSPPFNDSEFVFPGTKLLIQRVAWRARPDIEHTAQTELSEDRPSKKQDTKRSFPPEFVCPLCKCVLINPVVLRCSSKCGRSACRRCIEEKFKEKRNCPFCNGYVQTVIANKTLGELISKLDLSSFDQVPQKQQQQTGGGATIQETKDEVVKQNNENYKQLVHSVSASSSSAVAFPIGNDDASNIESSNINYTPAADQQQKKNNYNNFQINNSIMEEGSAKGKMFLIIIILVFIIFSVF